MNILNQIVDHKRKETAERIALYPTKLLEQSIYFDTTPVSMQQYLTRPNASGIIAEIKRKSPSKGEINPYVDIERTSIGYMQAGASAISILTDQHFFGGKNEDLTLARKFNYCPILRKDFILDEYQILEAKSIGADVILLIASILTPEKTTQLAQVAKGLGMEVLLEVHNENEAKTHPNQYIDLVGVNNRNLDTFEVNIENSIRLSSVLPKEFTLVSESGLSDPSSLIELRKHGYKGFLIGETFMKQSEPPLACADFVDALQMME